MSKRVLRHLQMPIIILWQPVSCIQQPRSLQRHIYSNKSYRVESLFECQPEGAPTMTKICLTGTTGGLGSRVLHHLLFTFHVPPKDIIISLYNPSKAPEPAKTLGVEVRKGDFTDPSSLKAAFQGADILLLVSYPSIAHKIRVDAHTNAIDAARNIGIKHIFYTSLAFGDESQAAVKQAHLDTEAYLTKISKESNITYTVIKEGIYSESFPLYLNFQNFSAPPSERTAVLPLKPSKGIAWVTRDELGEATAKIMLEDVNSSKWKNQRVLLNGSKAYTLDELAASISRKLGWEAHGAPLQIKDVGQDAWIDHMTEVKTGRRDHTETRDFISQWASTFPAIEKGELAVVDPLCEQLLGRPLVSMDDYLEGLLKDKAAASESMKRYAR